MKQIGILLLLFATPAFADGWLRAPDAKAMPPGASFLVSANAFSEVAASTLDRALAALADKPFVSLSPAGAADYSNGHFSCIYPERPYLVRAVYENEATGAFSIKSNGKAVWIAHSSLGKAVGMHRTVLVVCLGSPPETVFVTASSAL